MSQGLSRNQVAWRIAQDIGDGTYVNLGIGQPELVANYVPEDREIVFHSENGILGMGPEPKPDEGDEDLINAGKKPVTMVPGGSFFHHADSFAMVRGGHIDICVLGAFQVSAAGDLANWSTGKPGAVPGVGGAMDLAAGAKQVFVMMNHLTSDGEAKIVERCAYPLTGKRIVTTIFSDLAVIDVGIDGLVVREIVDLCGRLPLALGIAGRLVASLGLLGTDDWSGMLDVLREELRDTEKSHSGRKEEGMIRASLRGLKGSADEQQSVKSVFMLFALVPEDTHASLEVLQHSIRF